MDGDRELEDAMSMEAKSPFGNFLTNVRVETSKAYRKLLALPGSGDVALKFPEDFSDFSKRLWRDVVPYTMTSKERIVTLEYAVRYIEKHAIQGDIVECGVFAGGSTMAAAYTLLELGNSGRRLFLYDTFAGMTEPTKEDVSNLGKSAMKKYDERFKDGVSNYMNVPIEQVRANLGRTGYPSDNLNFVQGVVESTLPLSDHKQIALLRLDTDWYESTRIEMDILYPKLAVGGILIIDDYYRWLGQQKAVDDYIAANNIRIFLTRVDTYSVIAVKQH